jgi:hypothetical protein
VWQTGVVWQAVVWLCVGVGEPLKLRSLSCWWITRALGCMAWCVFWLWKFGVHGVLCCMGCAVVVRR